MEIAVIISALISVSVIIGISLLINILIGGNVSGTAYYISLTAITAITCVSFAGSYLLSAFIFQTKEF